MFTVTRTSHAVIAAPLDPVAALVERLGQELEQGRRSTDHQDQASCVPLMARNLQALQFRLKLSIIASMRVDWSEMRVLVESFSTSDSFVFRKLLSFSGASEVVLAPSENVSSIENSAASLSINVDAGDLEHHTSHRVAMR